MLPFGRFTVLTAIVLSAAVASAADEIQCGTLDHAVTEKLKPLIERSDPRSTALAGAVIKELSWARLDCREGRVGRAEAGYRQILAVLRSEPAVEAQGLPATDFASER